MGSAAIPGPFAGLRLFTFGAQRPRCELPGRRTRPSAHGGGSCPGRDRSSRGGAQRWGGQRAAHLDANPDTSSANLSPDSTVPLFPGASPDNADAHCHAHPVAAAHLCGYLRSTLAPYLERDTGLPSAQTFSWGWCDGCGLCARRVGCDLIDEGGWIFGCRWGRPFLLVVLPVRVVLCRRVVRRLVPF